MADKSAHEWDHAGAKEQAAYRAGMWWAFHSVENFIGHVERERLAMSRHSQKEIERIKRIAASADFGKPSAGSAAVQNAILAYELLEKVKQILHATDEVAEDGCRLAATVLVNLERGTLKDDEHGTLRKLAHNVLHQDPKQQNTKLTHE